MQTVDKRPKGIRNNNPGNIEWGAPWQGLVALDKRTDVRFCQFAQAVDGIRAIARTLITYYDKRTANDGSKIDTIREIIERWAPASDNNDVGAYASSIASLLSDVGPNDVVNMHDYRVMRAVVEGIIRHENGRGPLKTPNTWYESDVIDEGLRRAGVVEPVTSTKVAKRVVAPASLGVIGVDQIVQAAPDIISAVKGSQADLTSGNVIQMVLGGVVLGLSLAMLYRQLRAASIGAGG